MCNFIKVQSANAQFIYVNLDLIVALEKNGDKCKLITCYGQPLELKESLENVLSRSNIQPTSLQE